MLGGDDELPEQLASHPVDLTEGKDDVTLQSEREGAQLHAGVGGLRKLGAEFFLGEGSIPRSLQGKEGADGDAGGFENELFPGTSGNHHIEGTQMPWLDPAAVGLAEALVEFGVVGFPDAVADLETGGIEVAVAEVVAILPDLVNAAPLFLIGVASRVKDDAIARLDWNEGIEGNEIGTERGDGSDEGAAFFPKAGMDEFLVVHPVHPSGVESPGEGHLELVTIRGIRLTRSPCQCGVDRLTVDLADGGDVLRGFQSSLDLEADDTAFDQLRDVVHGRQILRGEEVATVAEIAQGAVDHKLVGHAAGLGALAAVGTPLTERLAGETLAGVGDAERPVDKDLQGHARGIESL